MSIFCALLFANNYLLQYPDMPFFHFQYENLQTIYILFIFISYHTADEYQGRLISRRKLNSEDEQVLSPLSFSNTHITSNSEHPIQRRPQTRPFN